MKWTGVVLAVGAVVGTATASPPVTASIETAWPAADLVTQYLETLALEKRHHLLPFLAFLAAAPTSHRNLDPPLLPASQAAVQSYVDDGINAIFASEGTLQANETLALLEHAATHSRLFRDHGLSQSVQLSLANRETTVTIEAMRRIWQDRHDQISPARDCDSYIDVAGQRACSVDEFWNVVGDSQRLDKVPIVLPAGFERPPVYQFDHMSPVGENDHLPRVVLYGSPVSPPFQSLFSFLYELSAPKPVRATATASGTVAPHPPRLQFVLRWKPNQRRSLEPKKLVLSGYGAALDIKKSDYLAIDDRMQPPVPEKGAPAAELPGRETTSLAQVKKSDIPDLSIRTASFIATASDPFKAFTSLTSSFPRIASQLASLAPDVDPQLLSEVSSNQLSSSLSQKPSFLLNGISLTEAQVDPFALLRLMRKERRHVTALQGLSEHMTTKSAREILIEGGHKDTSATARGVMPVEALGELFDATDRSEGGQVILWWNDLERDRRYKSWPTTVRDLLRPSHPGSMNLVARNLNNIVFCLDLSQPSSLVLVTRTVKQFINRGIPVRFGLVPLVTSVASPDSIENELALTLWYLVDAVGRGQAIRLLEDILEASPSERITPDLLRRAYTSLYLQSQHSESGPLSPFELVMAGPAEAKDDRDRMALTRDYLDRLGVSLGGHAGLDGCFFLNGAHFPIDEDFSQNLQKTLGQHLQFLQQKVYFGELTDEHDANSYFGSLPSTYERRNEFIFTSAEAHPPKLVNLLDAYDGIMPDFVEKFYIDGSSGLNREKTQLDVEAPAAIVTMTIVADINELAGMQLVKAAMQLAGQNTSVRISIVHNPVEHYEAHPWALSNILYLLHHYDGFRDLLPDELVDWIDLNLTVGGPLPRHGKQWAFGNPLRPMLKYGVEESQSMDAQFFWEELQWFVHKLGFQPGQNGIIINGRAVGPFPDKSFGFSDLRTLLVYELDQRINSVVRAIQRTGFDLSLLSRSQQSRFYNLASSIVQQAYLPDPAAGLFGSPSTERSREYMDMEGEKALILNGNDVGALHEIAVVIDPATEIAQRWAPIIETLASLDTVHLRLYLNPSFALTELPIKRFYQYSLHRALSFDEESGQEIQPTIRFEDIPEDTLLTFAIDTQQSWLAFPRTSVHDLDNIRLGDLPETLRNAGIEAAFELESLVVEGHAREIPSSKAPRGLQLELSSGASELENTSTIDTIVMANLGYFQFKASPGIWRLGLRPGKSSEIYEIESVGAQGWKSAAVSKTGDAVLVTTLEGSTLYPRFQRRPGHESSELLSPESPRDEVKPISLNQVLSRIRSMVPFLAPTGTTDLVATAAKADINVFTVASGLLYERMAFLMVVSVMRHTKSSVKFWFIQNFLSPSFKAFIPHMAREYGFDYELVTYKWPHWLRDQKEKQRTIWGYKILFLDVLFPLELDRVIFVDSDQIVRADLQELIDLDLQGAPYAYAPMGNDREETKGYRFWEHGYWKQHLDGRPYHISALYVVDLDRFRQLAAGDRLRQQYQALTADPGSLANLDQDLPNNMQNTLPIFTLDRSWLWCETWCSDESLATAKTIDLCNNPKTKEQKLARARRLIPEWTVYDEEVSALARRIASDVATSAGQQSELSAFGQKADELEQAVQQRKEREKALEESERQEAIVRDEL
ncbi:Kre5p [Sporobolomyces koalae]|uniref:Kre5p n=1 Tax=Sporobolomyces koalae TaxID=500713 RepID=UPI00317694F1